MPFVPVPRLRRAVLLWMVVMTFAGAGLATLTTASASERAVAQAYRDWVQAHVDRDARRICALTDPSYGPSDCVEHYERNLAAWDARTERVWRSFEVVDVSVDGDSAGATLRWGPCTLRATEAWFWRGEDGRWRYRSMAGLDEHVPYCQEQGVEPPRVTG